MEFYANFSNIFLVIEKPNVIQYNVRSTIIFMRFKEMKKYTNLKNEVRKLPSNPGVYLMKSKENEIIYIGKAKNLKNRVSSYFLSNSGHSDKVKKMVSNVYTFDYIITDSEFEALVLECSLIKKHQPKYNILLKDDKGYSYIKITNEKWPRILHVKQKTNDGAFYIGPYTNSFSVKNTVEEIVNIFKIPTCNRDFSKFYKRACLNYYIKKCSAPCIRAITNDKYMQNIDEAKKFIKHGSKDTVKYLNEKMKLASENLNFEYAAELRDRIKAIANIKERQKVVSYKTKDLDVIACVYDEKNISFEVFRFSKGDLYDSQNFIVDYSDDISEVRSEFLSQYYSISDRIPKNIFIDGEVNSRDVVKEFLENKKGSKVNISIPKIGDGLLLLEMCKNNANEALLRNKENKNFYEDILESIKNVLLLKNVPEYIEAYDISNLKGTDNVGCMVVFKDGKPFKSAYRKFKIKDVSGQDDYGSMKEMLSRRFDEYLKSENSSENTFFNMPDLILIDGGMAHTAAAKEVISSKNLKIPIFGMVKDGKHRTRAITTEGEEIEIKNNSRVFSFITSVQDEVHRFTIGYHKKLRNQRIKKSELTKIEGIGDVRAKKLLKVFGSVKRIADASSKELALVDGMNELSAKSVYGYFHGDKDNYESEI